MTGEGDVAVGNIDYSHRSHTRDNTGPVQTGGIFDGIVSGAEDAYDTVAGAADHAAGSTDESFSRTVDELFSGNIGGAGDEVASGFGSATDELIGGTQDILGLGDDSEGESSPSSDQDSPDSTDGDYGDSQSPSRDFNRTGTPTTENNDGGGDNNPDDEQELPFGMTPMHLMGGTAVAGFLVSLAFPPESNNSSRDRGDRE